MNAFPKVSPICSDDDIKDNLNYAIIKEDGMLVATDAHALIELDLPVLLPGVDITHLKGKAIHRSKLRKMEMAKVNRMEFEESEIVLYLKSGAIAERLGYSAVFDKEKDRYDVLDDDGLPTGGTFRFPVYEHFIPTNIPVKDHAGIALNATLLNNVQESFGIPGVRLDFIESRGNAKYPNRAVWVHPISTELGKTRAIIMPIEIKDLF